MASMTRTVLRRGPAWWVAVLVVLFLLTPRDVYADVEESGAHTLIQNLMSPYCPGLLLSDCRSEGARQLRAEIERRMTSGESAEAVEDDLVSRFGPEIRTMPEFEGVGLLAWLGPPFFGLAGLGLVVLAIRAATRRHAASREPVADDGVDARLVGRLRDELAALD